MKMEKMTNLQIRIPKQLRDELQAVCKAGALNRSEVIRRLIATWLEKQKS